MTLRGRVAEGTAGLGYPLPVGYTIARAIPSAFPGVAECIWAPTATVTVANTVLETSLFSASEIAQREIAANLVGAGTEIAFRLRGHYGASAAAGTDGRLRVKLGSTVLLDSGVRTFPPAATGTAWAFDGLLQCETTGLTGAWRAWAALSFAQADAAPLMTLGISPTSTIAVDTTVEQIFNATLQWSVANAANTWTRGPGRVEITL